MWRDILQAVVGGLLAIWAAELIIKVGAALPWNEVTYAAAVVAAVVWMAVTLKKINKG